MTTREPGQRRDGDDRRPSPDLPTGAGVGTLVSPRDIPASTAPNANPRPDPAWWGHPWHEGTWSMELARLMVDPVWWAPRRAVGEGRPLLLVPGFLTGDASLHVLASWLRRRGYVVALSGIRLNARCAGVHLDRLERSANRLYERSERQITVIGHSRGGLFAGTLADLRPDLVDHVVTLGSPLADRFDVAVLTHAAVAGARRVEQCRTLATRRQKCPAGSCWNTPGTRTARIPPADSVALTCVVTRDDGVVAPRSCTLPGAVTHEVSGTHLGLVVNREVYRILDRVLPAGPPETVGPR